MTMDCPAIALLPSSLPNGQVGAAYSETFTASGGTAPYTYAVSGTLPNGLSLGTGTGSITGTPATAGQFAFVITATDANACTGAQGYAMTLARAAAGIPTLSTWGLLVLMVLTGLASAWYLRRAD